MTQPLAGVRVVEVASWVLAPTAGGVLAQWGADVVKIEHPRQGDPARALRHRGIVGSETPMNVGFHHANRNKRSVGIDIATDAGHAVLMDIVRDSDVFLTNFLPHIRRRLHIEVDDIRNHNPDIVYARASAVGPRGPERERGGYDFATFWSRSGLAASLHTEQLEFPPMMASGAMGDVTTGAFLAGAISAALFKRERGGGGSVVDVSLLATGAWVMALNVSATAGGRPVYFLSQLDRSAPSNPLVNIFRTSDGRFIVFCLLQPSWAFPELCERIGRVDLLEDPRFQTIDGLQEHSRELTEILDEVFGSKPLTEWKRLLDGMRGVWETVQDLTEVAQDPQVVANDYVQFLGGAEDAPEAPRYLVSSPAQFDETSAPVTIAPEHGQHTEEFLLSAGYDWADIIALKEQSAIT